MRDCECCGMHIASGRFCTPCGKAYRNDDASCIDHPDTWHCAYGNCDGSDCECMPYELVKGSELSIGDRVEYVGTSHGYSVAVVTDVKPFGKHGYKDVTFTCPLPNHGTHEHTYAPDHGYVRKMK